MAKNEHKAWQCILYPESAKDNWLQIIKESMYKCSISPLHDRDIKDDGEFKKPHYHINFLFAKTVDFDFVQEFCATFGGVMPVYIKDREVMDEYHIHYNDPDKAQYNIQDIQLINGYQFTKGAFKKDDKNMCTVEKLIFALGFTSYFDLVHYLHRNELEYLLGSVRRNTYHTNLIIKDFSKYKLDNKNN